VAIGEPLVELETEKVNTELPADEAGVLQRILRKEGETVKPGDALGVIATDGAGTGVAPAARATAEIAPSQPLGATDKSDRTDRPEKQARPQDVTAHEPDAPEENGRVRASPLAERMAEELHVDLSQVPPTTPGGRVTREDVEAFARSEERTTKEEG